MFQKIAEVTVVVVRGDGTYPQHGIDRDQPVMLVFYNHGHYKLAGLRVRGVEGGDDIILPSFLPNTPFHFCREGPSYTAPMTIHDFLTLKS